MDRSEKLSANRRVLVAGDVTMDWNLARTRKRLELVVKIEKWLTEKKVIHPLFVVAVGQRTP